ncbi:ThuA domain-containing protein [Compostibacter hankyongensis]|uniref:ThuA-like domain-containing protein n=1 Tax=Compostibacter hankyongensis TaxID=1007089 RepID=A0ABP8FIQ1_9BACT
MQRKLLAGLLIAAWVCMCGLTASAQSRKDRVNWKKVHVLVYTKNGKGYVHDNIPSAVACIKKLGADHGFSVDVSDNPADFNDDNLKKYNALVFTSTNNDVFDTDAQKVALMRYIQAGGGFVGIHSVTGTERHWEWFKRMLGGTFVRHAKHQEFKEIVLDPTNPSTAKLPRVWDRSDECYYITTINPDIHVLMVHDLNSVNDKAKPTIFGTAFPSCWCHEFDGGREWYTALGHDGKTYSEPAFQQHILGGIQWVVAGNRKLDYSKAHAKSPDDPLPY